MKSHIRGKMGRRVICSLAILSLICGILLPSVMVSARSKTKQKVVKVAFPEQEGMSFIGKFGKVTGYNYCLLYTSDAADE